MAPFAYLIDIIDFIVSIDNRADHRTAGFNGAANNGSRYTDCSRSHRDRRTNGGGRDTDYGTTVQRKQADCQNGDDRKT